MGNGCSVKFGSLWFLALWSVFRVRKTGTALRNTDVAYWIIKKSEKRLQMQLEIFLARLHTVISGFIIFQTLFRHQWFKKRFFYFHTRGWTKVPWATDCPLWGCSHSPVYWEGRLLCSPEKAHGYACPCKWFVLFHFIAHIFRHKMFLTLATWTPL